MSATFAERKATLVAIGSVLGQIVSESKVSFIDKEGLIFTEVGTLFGRLSWSSWAV